MEAWKDIPGYEGRYQASSEGRIRSVDRIVKTVKGQRRYKGQLLKPGRYTKFGHVSVVLGHGENGSPVHELVLQAFEGPRPQSADILHANGNPRDNRLANLSYGTRTDNILDVYRQGKRWRKLSEEDAIQIKVGLSKGTAGRVLAKEFNVSESTICAIKHGRTFWWAGEAHA